MSRMALVKATPGSRGTSEPTVTMLSWLPSPRFVSRMATAHTSAPPVMFAAILESRPRTATSR